MSDFGQPCRWCAVHDVQSPRAAEDEDAPGEEGGEHDPEALQAFLEADSALDAQGKLDDAIKQCKVGNSFLPDTRVLMADGGAVPIEDVAAGDEVLAFDPLTGTEGPREVTGTISGSGAKTLVDVAVDDGRGGRGRGHRHGRASVLDTGGRRVDRGGRPAPRNAAAGVLGHVAAGDRRRGARCA
ncbi:hypothetical protein GCM10009605_43400 [Nocardiopsis composta]